MAPTLRLGSERCQCEACSMFFSTTRNFDAHRVGPHDHRRRCLTPAELESKGYIQKDGVWMVNIARPAEVIAVLRERE